MGKTQLLSKKKAEGGFTLIELVMVMTVIGIIGATVAVFMRAPIEAYLSSERRASLTDVADTTARRLGRDLRSALPNSIRVSPSGQCLDFIPTKTGGRYRSDEGPLALDFTAPDGAFNMLGSNSALSASQRITPGDVIVIYNVGGEGADAYAQDNTAVVLDANAESGSPLETAVTFDSKKFPFESPSRRFQVVPSAEKVVSYVCSGDELRRTASNSFASSCLATGPALASGMNSCSFDYSGSDLQRNALVRMSLAFEEAGESVRLQHEVHISNAP